MLRLLNYILNLVIVLAFLILIVPFALLAANPYVKEVLNTHYKNPEIPTPMPHGITNLQFFHTGGSIASMVVFMVIAFIFLALQQFFWMKLTLKTNKFPVPKKWLVQYRYVGVLAAFTVLVSFTFALVAWAIPIGYTTIKTTEWQNFFYTREHIYIAFIVIIGVLGVLTMAYSAYVNLRIAYDQQIKIVDEGIKEGKYDPVTRKPYPSVASETIVGEGKITISNEQTTDKPQDDGKNDGNSLVMGTFIPKKDEDNDGHPDQQATAGFMGK